MSLLSAYCGVAQRRCCRHQQVAFIGLLLLVLYSSVLYFQNELNGDWSSPNRQGDQIEDIVDFITLHSPPSPHFDEDQLCPEEPPLLLGLRNVSREDVTLETVENELKNTPGLVTGGSYRPKDCQSRHKVAIVVPYRDRSRQLPIFLRHIHPFLQRQQLAYTIFLVEQTHGAKLNRGMLKNIGFMEAMRRELYECVIFNDIDMLPEDDRNLYSCPDTPRHLSVIIDIYNYELVAEDNFGGVVALTTPHFTLVNGYSNLYWGWGCEDDDLYDRVLYHELNITRPEPVNTYRYVMIPHSKDPPSPDRKKFLRRPISLSKYDGLTNLNYRRLRLELKPLFTHVVVDLVQPS